jgi:hypothetical protein
LRQSNVCKKNGYCTAKDGECVKLLHRPSCPRRYQRVVARKPSRPPTRATSGKGPTLPACARRAALARALWRGSRSWRCGSSSCALLIHGTSTQRSGSCVPPTGARA